MKLCMVYNPRDSKIHSQAYCSLFRDMFFAVIERFDWCQFVTKDYSAEDIDADLILFFDPHSSHHVKIHGIKNHPAVKMEYWNDVHQTGGKGVYKSTGITVHKLGHKERVNRIFERDVTKIISPMKYYFYKNFTEYFGNSVENVLLYFPQAPKLVGRVPIYGSRKNEVLGNGATWGAEGYKFRKWAFEQPYISVSEHWIKDKNAACGNDFIDFLTQYKAVLALAGNAPVPKYFEIPMAGCLTFAAYQEEYEELGFKDFKTCVYVDEKNFESRVKEFLRDPMFYEDIAKAGRDLVVNNYTSNHFADWLYKHVKAIKDGHNKHVEFGKFN